MLLSLLSGFISNVLYILNVVDTGCIFPYTNKTYFFFFFQTFYFVLNKINYTTYIKYNRTICGLAVGPLEGTGHTRVVVWAVAASQAEFTNC